jgi:hypothetical protein
MLRAAETRRIVERARTLQRRATRGFMRISARNGCSV